MTDEKSRSSGRRVCRACGGNQRVFVEVPRMPQAYQDQSDRPRVLYLRCEKCAQIEAVEE